MNPINELSDVRKQLDFDTSTELSKNVSDNFRKFESTKNIHTTDLPKNVSYQEENQEKIVKTVEVLKKIKTNDNLNIQENKENVVESKENSTDKNTSTTVIEESSNIKVIEEIMTKSNNSDKDSEDTNKHTCDVPEPDSGEDADEFGDYEDYSGEEEVDEIIVPDEAEAEDLTDNKDNEKLMETFSKSDLADEEDASKDDENDSNLQEEETSKSSESDKSVNNEAHNNNSSKHSLEDDTDIESELFAIEETSKDAEDSTMHKPKSFESHIDEDTTSQTRHDPLNCTDHKLQDDEYTDSGINAPNILQNKLTQNQENEATNEEEDDEVQFVETRNSPICIESDDDNSKDTTKTTTTCNESRNHADKQLITTAIASVAVPKNLTVTRTSARKSTAKHQLNPVAGNKDSSITINQIQSNPKHFNYLQKATNHNKSAFTSISTQQIVDCIELLDSSDEEATPKSKPKQQRKAPQKRTLLAAKGNYYKNNNNKMNNSDINTLPSNFQPNVRQQPKKPAPPPLPPPTPQSNFLNAVQLQPAAMTGQNPPAFSALLSNKSVIIPNAFYGNPPTLKTTPEMELERRYARWLENFINQFCKPQFVATHSCLVFLQRALKYKDFVRIKALRSNMNNHVQTQLINNQLMIDLKTIFLKNTRKISNYGRRFCELTCSAMPGKAVALMAHGVSGKVTLKTCSMDLPKSVNATTSSSTSSSAFSIINTSSSRKRQQTEDEDEYMPDKTKHKPKVKPPSENGDEDSSEVGDDRKRSLRTKRTKRLDNSFSYNEDDLLAEYEIDDEDDEKLVQVEIQRKIEQKRLEAQKQRQQQVKSFESAFIQAFAKSIDRPTTSSKINRNEPMQRIRLKNTTTATVTSIRQYTANNDAEDLLQATWIENVENNETQVISDDDEPKEHFIYKRYLPLPKLTLTRKNAVCSAKSSTKFSKKNQEEIITADDDYDENYSNPSGVDPLLWPKNADPQMYVNGKHKDRCIICNLSCQRLVHHYVNEHRGCEVYNSRLSASQIKLLKQVHCTVSNVSLYKNGQFQYEAFCIFCQKKSRFMLPYWYQHFTMHTGEYAYRCIGCGIRKPTRSLVTQHQAQGCTGVGGVAQDYAHDSKSLQIEAKICNLCNYLQLHRSNIVKHLHIQHNIKQILPKHIQTVVLMKTPVTLSVTPSLSSASSYPVSSHTRRSVSRLSSSQVMNTYVIDDDDNDVTYEEILPEETQPQTNAENNYYNYIPPYMQDEVNSGDFTFDDVESGGDDLSYMICGMLDVQMNPETN